MHTQLDLSIKTKAPKVSADEIETVCRHLDGRGWVLAQVLGDELQLSDRKLRAIAEHSDGRILSGQLGYRLFDRSTPLAEADQAASWLEDQGKKMLLRGAAIRRRFHQYARHPAHA